MANALLQPVGAEDMAGADPAGKILRNPQHVVIATIGGFLLAVYARFFLDWMRMVESLLGTVQELGHEKQVWFDHLHRPALRSRMV